MLWAGKERDDWSEEAGGPGDLGRSCAGWRAACEESWPILKAGEGARSQAIRDGGVLEPPGGVRDLARSRSGGEALLLTRS